MEIASPTKNKFIFKSTDYSKNPKTDEQTPKHTVRRLTDDKRFIPYNKRIFIRGAARTKMMIV